MCATPATWNSRATPVPWHTRRAWLMTRTWADGRRPLGVRIEAWVFCFLGPFKTRVKPSFLDCAAGIFVVAQLGVLNRKTGSPVRFLPGVETGLPNDWEFSYIPIRDVFLSAPNESHKTLCMRARRCTPRKSVRRPVGRIYIFESSYAHSSQGARRRERPPNTVARSAAVL